jgi:hypothetical protein
VPVGPAGQTKVGEANAAIGCEKDIRRRNIAMDEVHLFPVDAQTVRVVEGGGEALADVKDAVYGWEEPAPTAALEDFPEVGAVDVVHDEIRLSGPEPDFVDPNDGGVFQCGPDAGLVLEELPDFLESAVGREDLLDGDPARGGTGGELLGEIDLGHSTPAEGPDDVVALELGVLLHRPNLAAARSPVLRARG